MPTAIRSLPLVLAALFPAAAAAGAVEIPKDTVACEHIAAWSADRDANGLNMRAAPSIKGKVIGTLRHLPETADEGPAGSKGSVAASRPRVLDFRRFAALCAAIS